MQSKFIKILLFLTLSFGMALFVSSYFYKLSDQEIVQQIEDNIITETSLLDLNLNIISDNVAVGNYKLNNIAYPSYIFRNGKLITWNNNEYDVSDLLVEEKDVFNTVEIRKSILLYKKKQIYLDSALYQVITCFPIVTNYPFNNKYLAVTSNKKILPLGISLSRSKTPLSITFNGRIIFSINPPYQAIYTAVTRKVIQILTVLFTIGIFALALLASFRLAQSDKQKQGLVFLLSVIGLSRLLMLLFNYPNTYLNIDLFRSTIYVSSLVNNSIGELFLNNLSLLIILIYLILNKEWVLAIFSRVASKKKKKATMLLLLTWSFFMLQWYYTTVFNLLTNAQFPLDIVANTTFNILSVTAYLSILTVAAFYFFYTDLIYKIILVEIKVLRQYLYLLIAALVFFIVTSYFFGGQTLFIALANATYAILLYLNKYPSRLGTFRFGTFIYGLIVIILLAFISTTAVYKSYEFKELVRKEKLATKLLIDRDVEGEYLLQELLDGIKSDVFINSLLVNPQSEKRQIQDRIERYFSHGYFDNYNVKVTIFDKEGVPFTRDSSLITFSEIKTAYEKSHLKTDFEDIFFRGDDAVLGRKRYACFLNFERYDNLTGSAFLELGLKKQISKSVYPELLLEHRYTGKNAFDYAVFNDNVLNYNVGDFNYKADFDIEWLAIDGLYKEGIERNGLHHFGIKGISKTIIISSEVYALWYILSNFSFYFLLLLLGGILISIVSSYSYIGVQTSLSFSTKILIYIGTAFAIPIALVGFAVINTINTSYKSEIVKSYSKKTIAISENIVGLLENYLSDKDNKEKITNEISKISRTTRADINIYNTKGKLIATSQSKIFDSELLTNYINPIAYHEIIYNNKDKIIIDESIGNLSYKSSYIAIRAFEDGKLLGIMSSPFFGSKNHLNRQKTEVFNNIINITTLIFIFSIWFTYIAVRRLTNPIILIASKLKSTELKEENEPLEWKANDEIGVLVQEYNKMVEKLEVSKIELAKNEKEAAWREMAKQVAHEIKNPLTPMKLTLQHLDRVMDADDIRRKSLKTLLSQVDTLDEIVTSFSHFAKMPTPENIDFDIKSALEKIIDLHPDKHILFEDLANLYIVNADKKLFGRIFNNIILNAFQAMGNTKSPRLNIVLKNKGNAIQISFKDNGAGIPEDIQGKVFIPNFSTKDAGSGIGLAVAKRGIEQVGGKIYFESELGKGTVFYIELPIVEL